MTGSDLPDSGLKKQTRIKKDFSLYKPGQTVLVPEMTSCRRLDWAHTEQSQVDVKR